MRIGLDIDDVLADFMGAYKKYFNTEKYPNMLKDNVITKNVQQVLKKDKNFWLGLPVINVPDFQPTLYCTKRVNSKSWTKLWLELNGFPKAPIYQMYFQHGNKADMIKGLVDVFIDDSLSNVVKCNKSGVPALLFHTTRTEEVKDCVKIYSLRQEEIKKALGSLN